MITSVHKALYEFWSSFGLPVFLQGQVPENEDGAIMTSYPYITMSVASGDSLATQVMTSFCWHKKSKKIFEWSCTSVNEERAKLLDKIADAIPASGKRIELDGGGGYIVLYRYSGFQTYYDDPTDVDCIGGRVSYTVKFLTL